MKHKIIDMPHAIAETHRQNKIDRFVQAVAEMAAEYVMNSPKNAVRINVGKPPKGLSELEFMGRVGIRTLSELEEFGRQDSVAYSYDASEHFTKQAREREAAEPVSTLPSGVPGVRVVFHQHAQIDI